MWTKGMYDLRNFEILPDKWILCYKIFEVSVSFSATEKFGLHCSFISVQVAKLDQKIFFYLG